MGADSQHAVELIGCANWFDRFAKEITDAEPTRKEQIDGQWQAGRAGLLIYRAVTDGCLSIPDVAELVAQTDYQFHGLDGLSDASVSGQLFRTTVDLMIGLEGPFFPSPDITEDEAKTEEYQLVIRRQINAEGAVVCRRLADMIRNGTDQHLSGDDYLCTGEALIDTCRRLSKYEDSEGWNDDATDLAREICKLFYRFRCFFDDWRLPDCCEEFLEVFPQVVSDGSLDQASRIATVAAEAILDELGDTLPAEIVRTSDPPDTPEETQRRRLTRWNRIVGFDASESARLANEEMDRSVSETDGNPADALQRACNKQESTLFSINLSIKFTTQQLASRIGCNPEAIRDWSKQAQNAIAILRPRRGEKGFEYKGENLKRLLTWIISDANSIQSDFKTKARTLLNEMYR